MTTTKPQMYAAEKALDVDPTAEKEVLRVYEVELRRNDIVDDDGSPITFTVEVPLRYTQADADRREPDSLVAQAEAYRRAVKLELRDHKVDGGRDVFDSGSVRMVRSKLVEGRKK